MTCTFCSTLYSVEVNLSRTAPLSSAQVYRYCDSDWEIVISYGSTAHEDSCHTLSQCECLLLFIYTHTLSQHDLIESSTRILEKNLSQFHFPLPLSLALSPPPPTPSTPSTPLANCYAYSSKSHRLSFPPRRVPSKDNPKTQSTSPPRLPPNFHG